MTDSHCCYWVLDYTSIHWLGIIITSTKCLFGETVIVAFKAIDFKAATLKIRFRFPLNPVKMSLSDEELLASLCKHPRCTAGKDGHPMPDRCRILGFRFTIGFSTWWWWNGFPCYLVGDVATLNPVWYDSPWRYWRRSSKFLEMCLFLSLFRMFGGNTTNMFGYILLHTHNHIYDKDNIYYIIIYIYIYQHLPRGAN